MALALLLPTDPTAAQTKISILYPVIGAKQVSLWIAYDQGLFAKQGLDVTMVETRLNRGLAGREQIRGNLFAAIGIRLIDFKLEFGRVWDGDFARVILADEISPDGCRLWDIKSGEKLDKDRFRQDLGGVEEAYQEVARRLGVLQPEEESAVLDLDSHRKKRGK